MSRELVRFPDLAWDHFNWEQQRRTGMSETPKAAERYRETRAAFEARYGTLIAEYWSLSYADGAAIKLALRARFLAV